MEWILIFGTMAITLPIALFMKKNISAAEMYVTLIFGLFVQSVVDVFASFHFLAWGFYEVPIAELKSLWTILGVYPLFASMIINWFPYEQSWWKKTIYLLSWSIFSTTYEWLYVKIGIIWHMNWNLFRSFLLYPFFYYLLILHLRFFRILRSKSLLNGRLPRL
ncbi:hypothetical protein PAESOLCIP111_05197 [Paenibacillus solanacearum]|uniref:Uncharacterized protein n=1 Tax=Paenibacillus solanacearum TaxID=2048548 RepID=A0A916K8X7_9BACL|nr:CBO0543 family protein [Paenibacillus solanacearum]CAG7646587.1 hypothetical protein PAESOLCIP111_05197 [Paenibacillus solanacearum]